MGLLYLLLIVDGLLRIMEGMLFLRLWMAEDILPTQETVCSTDIMCRIFIFIYSFIYLSIADGSQSSAVNKISIGSLPSGIRRRVVWQTAPRLHDDTSHKATFCTVTVVITSHNKY
jgi:hypothetical protein